MLLSVILVLTVVVYAVDTGAFAARLAGVSTGRLVLAGTVYNVLALASRTANAIQATLVAGLVDRAEMSGAGAELLHNLRLLLLAAALGIVLGALLIPSLARLVARAVRSYELRGSLPRVIVRGASVQGLVIFGGSVAPPQKRSLGRARRWSVPRRWLLITVVVSAIYATTGIAAQYASVLVPQGVRTATALPALLNGVGAVLLVLLVDPVTALVTDQAVQGQRPASDVSDVVVWQIGGRLAGTLAAQLLLLPAAELLALVTRWVV
jgi:hypothetical protein